MEPELWGTGHFGTGNRFPGFLGTPSGGGGLEVGGYATKATLKTLTQSVKELRMVVAIDGTALHAGLGAEQSADGQRAFIPRGAHIREWEHGYPSCARVFKPQLRAKTPLVMKSARYGMR